MSMDKCTWICVKWSRHCSRHFSLSILDTSRWVYMTEQSLYLVLQLESMHIHHKIPWTTCTYTIRSLFINYVFKRGEQSTYMPMARWKTESLRGWMNPNVFPRKMLFLIRAHQLKTQSHWEFLTNLPPHISCHLCFLIPSYSKFLEIPPWRA